MGKKKRQKKTSEVKPKRSPGFTLTENQQVLVGVIVLIVLIIGYLSPIVFEGRVPPASDSIGWRGSAQSIIESREVHDSNPLWANNVFAGMPGYLISLQAPFEQPFKYVIRAVNKLINWRATYLILGAMGIIFLMRFWRFSPLTSTFSAIAYIWWPYLFGILEAGHNTKVRTMMLMPLILFAFVKLLKKPGMLNASLFAIFFSLGIQSNHYQVMFYISMALAVFGIFHMVRFFQQKEWRSIGIRTGLVIGALILSVGISSFPTLVVKEYSKYSIRGGTGEAASSGLSYDYATNWSLYPGEMMTFIIPRYYGGSSSEQYTGDAVPELKGRTIPGYWGHKIFTTTTDYMGVISLFFVGIALVFRRRDKRVLTLAVVCVLSLLVSFGKHFPVVYDLFFNFVPYFNQFRIPSMILVLVQLGIAILAGFGFEFIVNHSQEKIPPQKIIKTIAIIFGIFVFLGLIPLFLKSVIPLAKADDLNNYQPQLLALIKEARFDMLKQDSIRLLLLATVAFGITLAYLKKWVSKLVFTISIPLLLVFDLFGVSNRYLQNLVKPNEFNKYFAETATDKFLLQDQTHYRIFPLGQLYGTNSWSYRHQSIGGYHPAKLRTIQDLNEFSLYKGTDPGFQNSSNIPINWHILNMLNVKYVLAQTQIEHSNLKQVFADNQSNILVYENLAALPRVFTVGEVEIIKMRESRFARLNSSEFDPAKKAILEEELDTEIGVPVNFASEITRYEPNQIDIKVDTDSNTLMVLSEMYYPAGWKAYVDDVETKIYKTNHALRSIVVPAGKHEIQFIFKPKSYTASLWISGTSMTIVYLVLGLAVFQSFQKKKQQQPKS